MKKKIILLAFTCLLFIASMAQEANRRSIVLSDDGTLFGCTYESGAIEIYQTNTGKKVFEEKGDGYFHRQTGCTGRTRRQSPVYKYR
jgi:hypothetical protein